MKMLTLTMLAALLSVSTATAQEVYESIVKPGIYSYGECSDKVAVIIIAAGRQISFVSERYMHAFDLSPNSGPLKSGWQKFSEDVFLRMSPNGGFDWLTWKEGDGRPPQPTQEDLANLPSDETHIGESWDFTSYKRCESLPLSLSIPHGEPIMFLLEAQEVIELCDTDQSACMKGLFEIADRHPDGALTTAEWSRVIRVAIYLGVLSDDGFLEGLIDVEDTVSGFGVSLVAAPLIARALISSYDYDGDGKTSLEELSHDLSFDGLPPVTVSDDLDEKARAQIDQIISSAKGLLPLLMGMGR
jgi:hypothetical protein